MSPDSLEQHAANWKQNRDTLLARIFIRLSSSFLYRDNSKARRYADSALALSNRIQFKSGIAKAYNNIGLLYSHEDNLEVALDYLNKSLSFFSEKRDSYMLAVVNENIGIVYGKSSQYHKAINSFNEAIRFTPQKFFNEFYYQIRNNIANCYYLLGDMEKTKNIYTETLHSSHLELSSQVSALSGLGNVYFSTNQPDSAFYYFQQAEKVSEKGVPEYFKMKLFSGISKYYLKKGDSRRSIDYLVRAYNISLAENNIAESADLADQLAVLYEGNGDFKNAFKYARFAGAFSDSVNKISNIAALNKIEADFELRSQNDKLKLLEQQQSLTKERLVRTRLVVLLGTIVLLGLLLMAYGLYRRGKLKERISAEKLRLADSDLKLKAMESYLEGQRIERSRLARDLHDGLGATLAGIKLKTLGVANKFPEQDGFDELVNDLSLVCDEVRNISHNLTPPEFSKSSLREILEQLIQNYRRVNHPVKFNLFIDKDNLQERLTALQKSAAYRIIQEALHNAVKHADARTISVLITSFENHINFMIEDDGKGFDTSRKSDGIGLSNMHDRALEIQSNLNIDSARGRGTVIDFNLNI